MQKVLLIFLSATMLIGCESLTNMERASDLRLDLRDKQVLFDLSQDVTISPRRARTSFQNGVITAGRDLYQPFCILEIDSVDHEGFTVTAGTFDVVRIQRSTVQIASTSEIQVAAAMAQTSMLRGNRPSKVHDGYHFWLDSSAQPSVRRLTCYGVFDWPAEAKPPTLEEIAVALGAIGSLNVQ